MPSADYEIRSYEFNNVVFAAIIADASYAVSVFSQSLPLLRRNAQPILSGGARSLDLIWKLRTLVVPK